MALSGGWKQGTAIQALPNKWGTGINPIHALATEGSERSSLTARLIAPNYGAHLGDIIPVEETDSYSYAGAEGEAAPWMGTGFNVENEDGWTPESDLDEAIWGYGDDTGVGDRPRWDAEPSDYRGSTELLRGDDFPAMNETGTRIRASTHGASVTKSSKVRPTETVSEGWLNKVYGEINDAEISNEAQLTRNTSMQQRDKVRAGSQRGEGSASEHVAPIGSHIVGMRVKVFSGGQRHYDMTPRQAEQHIRPWWSRTAGTAPEEWMEPNEMALRTSFTRQPPDDPQAGPSTPLTANNGYVDEDVIPFA